MSGQLKRGINLQSVNGVNYTVKNFIGEGGQRSHRRQKKFCAEMVSQAHRDAASRKNFA